MNKLKNILIVLFLISVVHGCTMPESRTAPPPEPETQIDTADFAENIMLSLLSVRRDIGTGIIGSGVLLEIDGFPYMMTALHVIDHMVAADRRFKQSACRINTYTLEEDCVDILIGPFWAEQVRLARPNDGALLPLDRFPDGAQPAELVTPGHNFRVGEELWSFGNPTGTPNIVTRGVVSGRVGASRHFSGAVFTDSDVWVGTSGGGVFLSTGEYVGYVRAMIGSRTPSGREIAEGLNIFSPLRKDWGLDGRTVTFPSPLCTQGTCG